jgi:predicted metalloprotease with PDZ domain
MTGAAGRATLRTMYPIKEVLVTPDSRSWKVPAAGRRSLAFRAGLSFLCVGAALWLLAPAAAAQAQSDTVRYTLAVPAPAAKLFRISAEFPSPGDELLASIPAWTPGSYEIENYARNVSNFSATDGSGKPLVWDKRDPDTWRVRAGGSGPVRIQFEYFADSLDLDKSMILEDFAFFNGTNVFPFEEDKTARPALLTLDLPAGWKVATGLPTAGGANRFRARDYDELVDAPTFIGNFQLDAFTAGGKPAQFAVYPGSALTEPQRSTLRNAIDRILTEQNEIVGAAPYDSYTVLLYLTETTGGVAGGLEHANSHFDILPLAVAEAFDQALPIVQSLISHETFHLWNVKRIRPAAMWPYDYDEWQPTELLWFSEGVNDYYSDVTLLRSGLYSQDQFFGQIENNMSQVEGEPSPIAVEDASFNTWINPVHGNRYIYYPKGSLLGLLLDVRIRHASQNKRSFDDVVRELYKRYYSAGRGFTTEDLLKLIGEAGDADVADFYDRYVTGREPLPYPETLALGGMRLERQESSVPFLGVSALPTEEGDIMIAAVSPGSPAAAAGVQPGDVLVAVGEVDVQGNPAWSQRFQKAYAGKANAVLPLRVRRNGREQDLSTRVGMQKTVDVDVSIDPAAGALEREILRSLATGDASR